MESMIFIYFEARREGRIRGEFFITTWFDDDDNDEQKVTKASQDKATSRKTNQLWRKENKALEGGRFCECQQIPRCLSGCDSNDAVLSRADKEESRERLEIVGVLFQLLLVPRDDSFAEITSKLKWNKRKKAAREIMRRQKQKWNLVALQRQQQAKTLLDFLSWSAI